MALCVGVHRVLSCFPRYLTERHLHLSAALNRVQAGRYKPTIKKNKPLTYEMANPPHLIKHRKSWNSWNTSNIKDGNRPSETTIEDMFIRKFFIGTWHGQAMSEIIIKRQHNMIRVAVILNQALHAYKLYFLIGYTEELLSVWLQCPVKLELLTIANKESVVFKYR
ncbi:hypothetical protein KM043_016602 [Ampulex compressa]|nr:hypothetical protein KM043_016602 [Ampulex compressa]